MSEPAEKPLESAEKPLEPVKKLPWKVRLKKLYEQYGWIALVTYLVITAITIAVFSIIIGLGFGAESSNGILGTIIAGWLAAKLTTMPLRIVGTITLTPLIHAFFARRRKARGVVVEEDEDDDLDDEESSADQP